MCLLLHILEHISLPVLPMAVAWSCSATIWCCCSKLCTSGFMDEVMLVHNGQYKDSVTQQGQHRFHTAWHIQKLTHQVAALDRGRSLMSTVALLCCLRWPGVTA